MKRIISLATVLALLVAALCDCSFTRRAIVIGGDSYSDTEGVSLTVVSVGEGDSGRLLNAL